MERSPAAKRPKLKEDTFEDLKILTQTVADLRTTAKMVKNQIYNIEANQKIENLNKTEYDLGIIENYEDNVPDANLVVPDARSLSKEHRQKLQKVSGQLQLLKILEQMKNCPIAQVINEI